MENKDGDAETKKLSLYQQGHYHLCKFEECRLLFSFSNLKDFSNISIKYLKYKVTLKIKN